MKRYQGENEHNCTPHISDLYLHIIHLAFHLRCVYHIKFQ